MLWLKGALEFGLMGPIWSDQTLLMLNWDLKSLRTVGLGLVGALEQATKPISKKPSVAKDNQFMHFALIPTEKDRNFISKHLLQLQGPGPERLVWLQPNGGILNFLPRVAMHQRKP
jgi:hypothetical protein